MRTTAGVLLAFLTLAGAAAAQVPGDCEARADWIQTRLVREAHRVRVWKWGWGIGAVAGGGLQLGLAPLVDDHDQRVDLLIGGGSTLALLVPVLFGPSVDERPASGAADDCPARLSDAERRLAAADDDERRARGPLSHIVNIVFNVGVGLLLGLGFDQWPQGILSTAGGVAVGEVQIWTVPQGARDDLSALRAIPSARATLVPLRLRAGAGVSLVIPF
jgi:hypothetical protein